MRKTIFWCLVLIAGMIYTCANAQQEHKETFVVYYPAPKADYATVRLDPSDEPANPSPGQIYYNSTPAVDKILYWKGATGPWTELGGGSENTSAENLPLQDGYSGTAVAGDVYYDNITDTIQYYNKTGRWINIADDPFWSEGALVSATALDPFAHYNVYLANQTLRRVGLGTSSPEAAFHVWRKATCGSQSVEREAVADFNRWFSSTGGDMSMYIAQFPEGSVYWPYVHNSSWFYGCRSPSTALKFASLSRNGSISFNVGGYNNSNSEVMRLVNPGGESNPTPRVGIGNSTPPFALFVDSDVNATSVFAVRGFQPDDYGGQEDGYYRKSGYWNMIPWGDVMYLAFGLFCKPDGKWFCDNYTYDYGVHAKNSKGSRLGISPAGGLWMNSTGTLNADRSVATWDVNALLFDETGNPQCPSSRALKENFSPLDREDILQKIGRLTVTRWNYKSEDPSVTHIGPVAEDFNRLFRTGPDEASLTSVDYAGVNLAGLTALSARLNVQQQELSELRAAIKDMKSQVGRGNKPKLLRKEGGL